MEMIKQPWKIMCTGHVSDLVFYGFHGLFMSANEIRKILFSSLKASSSQ